MLDFNDLSSADPMKVRVTNVEDVQTAFTLRRRLDLSYGDQLVTWVRLCVDWNPFTDEYEAWVECPAFDPELTLNRVDKVLVYDPKFAMTSERGWKLWMRAINRALADQRMVLEV